MRSPCRLALGAVVLLLGCGHGSAWLREARGPAAHVVLTRVWEFDAALAGRLGAPSGLGVEFLVIPRDGAADSLKVYPYVGVAIDDRGYPGGDRIVSAILHLDDAASLKLPDGTSVSDHADLDPHHQGRVVRALIPGPPLGRNRGVVRIRASLGFGERMNGFEFSFPAWKVSVGPESL